jgi:hypothetical protein
MILYMVSDLTGGPGTKKDVVGFKDVPISEDSLTPEKLLERAGLDPMEYELRYPDTGEPVPWNRALRIEDGMKLDAAIKNR